MSSIRQKLGHRRGSVERHAAASTLRVVVLVSVTLIVTATLWLGTTTAVEPTLRYQSLTSFLEPEQQAETSASKQQASGSHRQLSEPPTAPTVDEASSKTTAQSERRSIETKQAVVPEEKEEPSVVANSDQLKHSEELAEDQPSKKASAAEGNVPNKEAVVEKKGAADASEILGKDSALSAAKDAPAITETDMSHEKSAPADGEVTSTTTTPSLAAKRAAASAQAETLGLTKAETVGGAFDVDRNEVRHHTSARVADNGQSMPRSSRQRQPGAQLNAQGQGFTAKQVAEYHLEREIQRERQELGPQEGIHGVTVHSTGGGEAHAGKRTRSTRSYDAARLRELSLQEQMESAHAAIHADPLRSNDTALLSLNRTKVDYSPAVQYLGVLVDAGRNYFPLDWLYRMLERLADMRYNLVHFRLTDDQTFNVLLDSHPELAYPTVVDNPGRKVYSPSELRNLTSYAKSLGIQIMPEINVPGHAGAWAGVDGLILNCAEFVCEKGYGLPINVSHPQLRPILTNVIREVLDIFDNPPFLHLGGDEVHMAEPCFEELGTTMFNYSTFEQMLKAILSDVGYPEEQVVRWEVREEPDHERAGKIEQFWESQPGVRRNASGAFFLSDGMYFDTNNDHDVFDVWSKALKAFNIMYGKVPIAIIGGTFELSTEFWFDRNVLGRLLSVSFGANNMTFEGSELDIRRNTSDKYRFYCNKLGFGDQICNTAGRPVVHTKIYHSKWRQKWVEWKSDICERLTDAVKVRVFRSWGSLYRTSTLHANKYFWDAFPLEVEHEPTNATHPAFKLNDDLSKLGEHVVPHAGVILDTTSSLVHKERLEQIIVDYVAPLGFNLVQLRLVGNNGFTMIVENQSRLSNSLLVGRNNSYYHLDDDLKPLVRKAQTLGIDMMPEVSVSTDSAGWIEDGLLMRCPKHFCTGGSVPHDVDDPMLLPVVFNVIAEVRKVFSSKYLHLGSDERRASEPCLKEVVGRTSDYNTFEGKLTKLLRLNGIPTENVLRYENAERTLYPARTGNITHYRAGMDNLPSSGNFFATVDLLDGDGWTIYTRTRDLASRKPLGILAEIRTLITSSWERMEIPKRLVSFALGLSEMPALETEEEFNTTFGVVVEALNWGPDSSPPRILKQHPAYVTESRVFVNQTCKEWTYLSTEYMPKKEPIKPFYDTIVRTAEA